jgi:hypothetical protein
MMAKIDDILRIAELFTYRNAQNTSMLYCAAKLLRPQTSILQLKHGFCR